MVLTVEGKSVCSLVTKLSVRRWMLALSTVCGAQSNKTVHRLETLRLLEEAQGEEETMHTAKVLTSQVMIINMSNIENLPPSVITLHFCLCQSLAASFPLAQFLRELCSQFKPNHRIHDEAQLNHPGTYNK